MPEPPIAAEVLYKPQPNYVGAIGIIHPAGGAKGRWALVGGAGAE